MADVLDFPARKVAPDSLPRPGDRYEAYGRAHTLKPVSLTLVFADGSMTSFPYARLERLKMRPLDGPGDPDGECVLTLVFGGKKADRAAVVLITGRDLFRVMHVVGGHRMHWFWELPEAGAALPEGSPVVHTIDIREADRRTVAALLADGQGDTAQR